MPSARIEWHVGWSVTVAGNAAPTSVTPRTSTRNSVSSKTRGTTSPTAASSAGSPVDAASGPCWWRTIPAHDGDGVTTASKPANTSANRRTSGTQSAR